MPSLHPSKMIALRGLWAVVAMVVAVTLGGCGETPTKTRPTYPADPCDDDPYGVDCPCALDPALEGCPDPCALEPPSSFCDAAGRADAGSSDAADAVVKPDAKADADATADGDGQTADDSDGAEDVEEPDVDPADVDLDADADNLEDGDVAALVDAPLNLPDGAEIQQDGSVLLADGNVVPPDQFAPLDAVADALADASVDAAPALPDGAEVQGDGTVLLPDGQVVAADSFAIDGGADVEDPGPPQACQIDADCFGPKKACQELRCVTHPKTLVKQCKYVNLWDGAGCDDGNKCTTLDNCLAGACSGAPLTCVDKDDNACTIPACDPALGCVNKNADTGSPCSDGNPCTDGDYCNSGNCIKGPSNKCECQKDTDCAAYDDGNLCNGKLKCSGFVCVTDETTVVWWDKGKKQVCDPAKDTICATNLCNKKTGKCEATPLLNGSACTDGDACTNGDACVDGACKAVPIGPCNDFNPCTTDSCDKVKGCVFVANALLCNDGDSCTDADACKDGICQGTPKGLCECETNADCSQYEDGDFCNGSLKCVAGQCKLDPTTVKSCTTSNPCLAALCDPKTGQCNTEGLSPGTPCSDNNACTQVDLCDGKGFCSPGVPLSCDDNNVCTNDACLSKFGCVNTFNDGQPCNDGEPCTQPDKCQGGKCAPGANICECFSDQDCIDKVAAYDKCVGGWVCDLAVSKCKYSESNASKCPPPANPQCAVNACQPATGECKTTLTADNTPCSDGVFCTVLDRCLKGTCVGDENPCDDGNPCTSDVCDASIKDNTACKHDKALLEALPCDDKSACTGNDTCVSGNCVGNPLICDDKNVCTLDKCDALAGCTFAPALPGVSCSDGNACTGDPGNNDAKFKQDTCDGKGACKGGDAKVCSSSEACVDIPCNPTATSAVAGVKLGCENKIPLSGKPCNDGDLCSTGDVCDGGVCKAGAAADCNDLNVCTEDGCVKATGCAHKAITVVCEDGDPCTIKDGCVAGKCAGVKDDCDDESICTLDSCDPVLGCQHKAGVGDCGDFAECSKDDQPKCTFKGGLHLVISEVYVGSPLDPKDDWVEIHNPTNGTAQLGDYVLEARPFDADAKDPWVTLASGKAGLVLPPYAYALFGNQAVAQGGVSVDMVAPGLDLALALKALPGKPGCGVDSKRHLQLRLRDVPHQLEHDRIHWDDGQAAASPVGVKPVDSATSNWPAYASIERKATQPSDTSSMAQHRPEWLAGNAYDSDDDEGDFIVRWWPEPQNRVGGQYEPACNGTCGGGKLCNFNQAGEKCMEDVECKSFGVTSVLACGVGKVCGNGASACVPDPAGSVVISEVHFGTGGEQFIELYNVSTKPIPIGGWQVQRKTAEQEPFKPWTQAVAVIPAGVTLAPKRYYIIGTREFARTHGMVDQVRELLGPLELAGGALRLWDPSSDTELDLVGWGNAQTYTNAGVSATYKPAAAVAIAGYSLERKAKAASTQASMKPGGGDDLAGNGSDTGNDINDFMVMEATPQTQASGVYEPACAGSCPAGLVCNYLGGVSEKCVDPLCGVPCDIGLGCNPKTLKCDIPLVIAELATDGPPATNNKGMQVLPANNEYVVLYNGSASTVQFTKTETQAGKQVVVDSLTLQWQLCTSAGGCATNFTKLTDTDVVNGKPLVGSVAPYSYFLVAPLSFDVNLPTPDFVSNVNWGLDGANGVLRLARINATGSQLQEYDRVVWGAAAATKGEGKTATQPQVSATCGDGQNGALRRKAIGTVQAADVGDPSAAAYYNGAGLDTNNNANDWVRIPQRTPRSQLCTWPGEAGSTKPFCTVLPSTQKP